ncbi:MAG: Lsm family RNA-binding protein [Candidatus Bathyarchaeia archaeon]|nr:Lsm family RNA-binding protein [Candidatus Bathyarchaeota archaeon]
MSAMERRFITEVTSLVDKVVSVVTVDGKTYTGTLTGIDPNSLSLCLSDARDDKGRAIPKIVISGSRVAEIFSIEKPFDLKGLAERLERVFPKMVRLYEKEGFIWVMDRIKVTKDGVVEGTGPAAERVQKIYEQFIQETMGKLGTA